MKDIKATVFKKTSDESLAEALDTFVKDLRPDFESGEAVGMMLCCSVQLQDGGGYVRQAFGGMLTENALTKLAKSIPIMAEFIQGNGRPTNYVTTSGKTLH